MPGPPSELPIWAADTSEAADQEQTLNLSGVPASGGFILGLQATPNLEPTPTAVINWNDNLATILGKLNAIYAPGDITGTGSLASQTLTFDMGVESQTNLIQLLTVPPATNTLLTGSAAPIIITPSINQAGLLPPLVQPDSGHQANGFHLLEFIAFNVMNWWMNNVYQWIQFLSQTATVFWGGTDTGNWAVTANVYVLMIPNFPTNADIEDGTVIEFIAGSDTSGGHYNPPATNMFIAVNGQANIAIQNKYGAALTGYDIFGGQLCKVSFNGTVWILDEEPTGAEIFYAQADTGSANDYIVVVTGVPPSQAPSGSQFNVKLGSMVVFIPANPNTGASQIQINLTTPILIKNMTGGALIASQLNSNKMAVLIFDGINFRLQGT